MNKLIASVFCFLISSPLLAGFLPQSFEADFADVRGKKSIPVTIKYKFPKQIYYEVKGDAPLLYVCNEKKTWKYTPPFIEGEKGELAVGDSGQFCYSRIFDALAKGLSSNDLYTVSKKGELAVLTFKADSKKQLGLSKIEISFDRPVAKAESLENAKELKMFLSNKPEPVKLVMKTYKKNPDFKKDQFSFTPPKNTNITRMR